MSQELTIYCDESEKRGRYYSNFYGGVLVRSNDAHKVIENLNERKKELNLSGEVKFQKITENYESKYKALLDTFFQYVAQDILKVRIMFTQNYIIPNDLNAYHHEQEYFLLYYQFIKHAFGLRYANDGQSLLNVRLYLDQLPDTKEKAEQFKSYIEGLNYNSQFKKAGIQIRKDQIAEVDSREHVLLQCLDIVLGAMQFRLNDWHKEKPDGQRKRGKRTTAKEKIYKHIYSHTRNIIDPNFNIGNTTGKHYGAASLWLHSYRHWRFVPKNYSFDKSATK